MKFLKILITIALILMIFMGALLVCLTISQEKKDGIVDKKTKKLMKYHGTWWLCVEPNGDEWFTRDGKKVYVKRGKGVKKNESRSLVRTGG